MWAAKDTAALLHVGLAAAKAGDRFIDQRRK